MIYAGCQWLMLVALAKVGSAEMVGQFSYGLAVTAPVILLTNLQLRSVEAADTQERFPFETYFGLRLASTALAVVIIVSIAAFTWRSSGATLAALVLGLGCARAFESVSDISLGYLQRYERMKIVGVSMMIRGALSVGALALVVWRTSSVAAGALVMSVVWGALLLAFDLRRALAVWSELHPHKRHFRPCLERIALVRLARLSLPLGVVMFFISLNANVPRYFIEHRLGFAELGVYSAVTYIVIAGGTLFGALGQAVTPRLARAHARRDRSAVTRLTALLVAAGALAALASSAVAAVAGGPLLAFLYRDEYRNAGSLFFWATALSLVWYVGSALGYAVTAMGSFRAQAPLGAAVTAVTAGACWVLVPVTGALGAVIAVAVGNVVQAAGLGALLRRELRYEAARTMPSTSEPFSNPASARYRS